MSDFTPNRRALLKGGASVLAGAATVSVDQLMGFAQAWAQTSQWKPEAGAKINLLRWKRFVEAEDVAFMNIIAAFTKATGVEVNVSNESYDDLQPKASVAANTGQGLDMVWGLYSLPHLLPTKCVDVTDVAGLSRQGSMAAGPSLRTPMAKTRPASGSASRSPAPAR